MDAMRLLGYQWMVQKNANMVFAVLSKLSPKVKLREIVITKTTINEPKRGTALRLLTYNSVYLAHAPVRDEI